MIFDIDPRFADTQRAHTLDPIGDYHWATILVGAAWMPCAELIQGIPKSTRTGPDEDYPEDRRISITEETAQALIVGLQSWLADRQTERENPRFPTLPLEMPESKPTATTLAGGQS